MSTWKVELLQEARGELAQILRTDAKEIVQFLQRLEQSDDPRAQGQGISFLWRYIVLDAFQVIAAINQEERRITITAIRPLPF